METKLQVTGRHRHHCHHHLLTSSLPPPLQELQQRNVALAQADALSQARAKQLEAAADESAARAADAEGKEAGGGGAPQRALDHESLLSKVSTVDRRGGGHSESSGPSLRRRWGALVPARVGGARTHVTPAHLAGVAERARVAHHMAALSSRGPAAQANPEAAAAAAEAAAEAVEAAAEAAVAAEAAAAVTAEAEADARAVAQYWRHWWRRPPAAAPSTSARWRRWRRRRAASPRATTTSARPPPRSFCRPTSAWTARHDVPADRSAAPSLARGQPKAEPARRRRRAAAGDGDGARPAAARKPAAPSAFKPPAAARNAAATATVERHIAGVITALEVELSELNTEYLRATAQLSGGSDDGGAASGRLHALVRKMEAKGEQLAALRGTHGAFTRELGAAREEIAATRGALEATAETAAARLRKVKALRGRREWQILQYYRS